MPHIATSDSLRDRPAAAGERVAAWVEECHRYCDLHRESRSRADKYAIHFVGVRVSTVQLELTLHKHAFTRNRLYLARVSSKRSRRGRDRLARPLLWCHRMILIFTEQPRSWRKRAGRVDTARQRVRVCWHPPAAGAGCLARPPRAGGPSPSPCWRTVTLPVPADRCRPPAGWTPPPLY